MTLFWLDHHKHKTLTEVSVAKLGQAMDDGDVFFAEAALINLIQASRDGVVVATALHRATKERKSLNAGWWQDRILVECKREGVAEILSPCLLRNGSPLLDREWSRVLVSRDTLLDHVWELHEADGKPTSPLPGYLFIDAAIDQIRDRRACPEGPAVKALLDAIHSGAVRTWQAHTWT